MKRFLCLALCMALLISMPLTGAYGAQMNKGVPVWNEETVRQYALDYIEGKSMERLWGYYDLQIRRYLPQTSFETFLLDLAFLTGDFEALGSYRSFEEPENKLKTHVLHLCMEKMDLDMYFTHKDKEDDWEIMAVEFVPAQEEDWNVVDDDNSHSGYAESIVTVGEAPYVLEGILTVPNTASADTPVPACVLVHDFGPLDRSHTIGKTALFDDIALQFAQMGIATLRYDKRTFAYPDAAIETVSDEAVHDALSAIEVLKSYPEVDPACIIVVGVGFGAMQAPRIASESGGAVKGMICIGGTTDRLMNVVFQREKEQVELLPKDEANAIKNAVRNFAGMKEEKARELTLFGHNGYYFWEEKQFNAVRYVRQNNFPIYIAHGRNDTELTREDGYESYRDDIGPDARFASYNLFRGLNHLLMNDLSVNEKGQSEYAVETHLDLYAGRSMGLWILGLQSKNAEE